MGNVMIAMDDEGEALLRRLAQKKYSGKKGSLSKVVQEALEKLDEGDDDASLHAFLESLKKGINFKYRMYRTRSEIYD